MRGVAYDHEQRHAVPHHRAQLVGLVPDAAVVGERDPSPLPNRSKPYLVGAGGREVIQVTLDGQPCGGQDCGETRAEVAVGEEDNSQAARSYRTACSISSALKS